VSGIGEGGGVDGVSEGSIGASDELVGIGEVDADGERGACIDKGDRFLTGEASRLPGDGGGMAEFDALAAVGGEELDGLVGAGGGLGGIALVADVDAAAVGRWLAPMSFPSS
jgi:hypothetical protein